MSESLQGFGVAPGLRETSNLRFEFVSEPLQPARGTFCAKSMAGGTPGLPSSFIWRGQSVDVTGTLAQWKESSPSVGQLYLRRHCFRLAMSDGTTWQIYFQRTTAAPAPATSRWFLYGRWLGQTGESGQRCTQGQATASNGLA